MIDNLFYTSHARLPMSGHELEELRARAEAFNRQAEITGILIYLGGRFLQYLEGPLGPLRDLMDRIGRDERHEVIRCVDGKPVEARRFPKWSMELIGPESLLRTGMEATIYSPTLDFLRPGKTLSHDSGMLKR
ncbi:MAG: BLUF domain-containing protein [Planctomycetota bacterium]